MMSRLVLIQMCCVLLLLSTGCGKIKSIFGGASELDFGGTCAVAADQMGSFMAPVKEFPLRLMADNEFAKDDSEKAAIATAVQRWNAVGRAVAGHDFFQISYVNIPEGIRAVTPQDCSQNYAGDNSFYMVKEIRTTRWSSLGFTSSIPGATIRCAGGYDLDQQIVFLNPAPEMIDPRQFTSVVIHELGHVLGLDHSCLDSKGNPDYVSCKGLSSLHPYHVAIMFPRLLKGSDKSEPEIKDVPRENDRTRAQCLYSPK